MPGFMKPIKMPTPYIAKQDQLSTGQGAFTEEEIKAGAHLKGSDYGVGSRFGATPQLQDIARFANDPNLPKQVTGNIY
jgi:hypothetical protein